MPANPKKGVSYIRVSKKRDNMLTVDTQKDKMGKFCELHDIKLIDTYQDIDFSGRTGNRPAFQKLLSDIENEIINPNYFLVYKVDRFSRTAKEFYKFMTKLEDNNVDLISITQHFDTSTPIGRAMMGILIQFAQFESDMTGQRIKDNLQNNAEKGRWNGGNVPYGYIWDEEEKLLKPDPEESEIVKRIFKMYTRGHGSSTIIQYLEEKSIVSPSGNNKWDRTTISYLIRNPLYLGKIKYDNEVYNGQHEAIIGEDAFKQANKILDNYAESNTTESTYLLSGLTECGACGQYGFNTFFGSGKYRSRRYVCSRRGRNSKKECSMAAYDAESLEEKVCDEIFSLSNNESFFEKLKNKLNSTDRKKINNLEQKEKYLKKKINKLDKTLSKMFADHYEKEIIPENQFIKFSKKYEDQKEKIVASLENIRTAIEDQNLREENINIIKESISTLKESWDYLSCQEKNQALKRVVDKVILYKDKIEIDLFYTKIKINDISKKRKVRYLA
jgi:site-specific DNA recombinase